MTEITGDVSHSMDQTRRVYASFATAELVLLGQGVNRLDRIVVVSGKGKSDGFSLVHNPIVPASEPELVANTIVAEAIKRRYGQLAGPPSYVSVEATLTALQNDAIRESINRTWSLERVRLFLELDYLEDLQKDGVADWYLRRPGQFNLVYLFEELDKRKGQQ